MDIRNFKGAIFDLDGTLLDSMTVWHDVDVAFFKKRGMPLPKDYQERIKSMPFEQIAQYTKEQYGFSDSVEAIMQEWTDLSFEAYKRHILLKDGAFDLLMKFKEQGIKLAFATANRADLSEVCLRANGVDGLFDAHAYLSEVSVSKSEPDIYHLACKRLGLKPSECVVFEDMLPAILGAQKGGYATCAVFDESSRHQFEQMKAAADYAIQSFTELL